MAEQFKSTTPNLNSGTDNSSSPEQPDESINKGDIPEPTTSNPDPEQQRTSAIRAHNKKFSKTDWTAPRQVNGGHIVADAVAQIGQPHKWGGNKPGGFDSQGLAKYAYHSNGIPMSQMIHNQMQHGTQIEPSQLQPGDLVFVATTNPQIPDRTGVYAGSGIMVHSAPGAGVVASRISHVGSLVGAAHLGSVVRTPTEKPKAVPDELYSSDDVMPHNRIPAALKPSIVNVAGVHI